VRRVGLNVSLFHIFFATKSGLPGMRRKIIAFWPWLKCNDISSHSSPIGVLNETNDGNGQQNSDGDSDDNSHIVVTKWFSLLQENFVRVVTSYYDRFLLSNELFNNENECTHIDTNLKRHLGLIPTSLKKTLDYTKP
jgi:hypothetical protein